MSAPAAGTRPAGDTIAGVLGARYPYLKLGQCGQLEAAIVRALVIAAGGGCALAVTRPQPGGALDISILIIGSAVPACSASCPAPGGFPPPAPERKLDDDQRPAAPRHERTAP